MDFASLESAVTGLYDAKQQQFSFAAGPFSSKDIDDLLSGVLDTQSWVLTDVAAAPQPDPARQTVTVSGTCATFFAAENVPLTMVFFLGADGDAEISVGMDLGEKWTFVTAFPGLSGTVFDDVAMSKDVTPKYVFCSSPYTDPTLDGGVFVTGMNFYSVVQPTATAEPYKSAMALLGPFASTTAVGPMALGGDVPALCLTLGFQGTLTKYFPILKGHVEIQLVSQPNDATAYAGLLLGTSFDFGSNRGLTISTVLTPQATGTIAFNGVFTGIELPTPGQAAQDFLGLIGANDLYSSLPGEYQSSTDLFLNRITLAIGTTDLTPALVALNIGMPAASPGWALGDFATVNDVQFTATVTSPFDNQARTVTVAVSGQVDIPTAGPSVDLVASASATFVAGKPGAYELQAGLAPGSDLTLPVGDLVNKYLPAAVNLPDIYLNQLGVDFKFQSPKNHYGLYAGLDPNHPLAFRFGGTDVITVRYANFHIENDSNNGGPGGGIVGGISLFSLDTDFVYQAPGNFKITAQLPELTVELPVLARDLLGSDWAVPSWLPDITFPKTTLFAAADGTGAAETYTFAMMAQPSFGELVLQVQKLSSGWVFAGALQLGTPKIAAFSSLSSLAGMDVMFSVNELLFVFVSGNLDAGFQFPPASDFQGGTGKSVVLPSFAGAVQAGFYFYGSMTLNVAGQKNLELVQHLLDLDVNLLFQLMVFIGTNPEQNAYAKASVTGKINDSTTITGYIGARMEGGEPQFYLEGILTTVIDAKTDQKLTGAFAFELTENAAFMAASLIGSVTFGPVTLSNVVFVIGIDWELIPSLGFAAQIDLTAYGTTYDSSIALFFDSSDPSKSLFAGSISDVTLKQIADTVVGAITDDKDAIPPWLDDLLGEVGISGTSEVTMPASVADALDDRDFAGITKAFNSAYKSTSYAFSSQNTLLVVGKDQLDRPGVWYLTNYPASNVIQHYQVITAKDGSLTASLEAQIYYCMPAGGGSVTLGPPDAGLVFNPGIYASGTINFFMLHLQVALEIKQNQGFAADVALTQPIDILDGWLQLTGNADPTKGPHFSMSTYPVQGIDPVTNKPALLPAHFYLDGRIVFLGLTVATTVNVSTAGLLLDFKASVGDPSLGASFTVDASVQKSTGVMFAFSAEVHIHDPEFELFDVRLGTLDLNVSISCGMSFALNTSGAALHIDQTQVTIGLIDFALPAMDLDVRTQDLKDIPGIIKDVLKDLIWDFLSDAEHWLEWIAEGLIAGFEAIEEVLEDIYNALAACWGNEKYVVIAVKESLTASHSVTIAITPPNPTGDVTQAMINSAHDWAEQKADFLVTKAVIDQLRKTTPDDIADFEVKSLQNIEETYQLDENVNWYPLSTGPLPSLTSLGFSDPTNDQRFFTQASGQLTFHTAVSVDADFTNSVARVSVTVRYNNTQIGSPYIFTSGVQHTFSTAFVPAAGDNFELQYAVTYLNPSIQPVVSGWLKQKGPAVIVPITTPQTIEPAGV